MSEKRTLDKAVYAILIGLAAMVLLIVCCRSNQAINPFVLRPVFEGEYSRDGEEWFSLSEEVKFSALEGDLFLRGQFVVEGAPFWESYIVSGYLKHIRLSISVNGEHVYTSDAEQVWGEKAESRNTMASTCGSVWVNWKFENMKPEDIVEIHLSNPHSFGNPEAYNVFLDSFYCSNLLVISGELEEENKGYEMLSMILIIGGIVLMGMALAYQILKLPLGSILWNIGLMTIFIGGYVFFDMSNIQFKSDMVVFNTYIRQICIRFALLELGACTWKILSGKASKLVRITTYILAGINAVCLLVSAVEMPVLYDTLLLWWMVQLLATVIWLVCCIGGYKQSKKQSRAGLILFITVQSAVILELINVGVNGWDKGILIKIVYSCAFLVYVVWTIVKIAYNHDNSLKVRVLTGELKNSRIILATSQIKQHFIFNILNAISGMCKYDPARADETLVRFSRYLRNNIAIMQEDGLELFSKSLEHLEDYLALEQIRFRDKIHFVKKIETEDFLLPPLILQPLVENSIKHGLLPKEGGGTIWLESKEENNTIIISVKDNGIGYDLAKETENGGVGIENVRFRLKHMVDGTMEIKSRLQEGTEVIIRIPHPYEEK